MSRDREDVESETRLPLVCGVREHDSVEMSRDDSRESSRLLHTGQNCRYSQSIESPVHQATKNHCDETKTEEMEEPNVRLAVVNWQFASRAFLISGKGRIFSMIRTRRGVCGWRE